MFFLSKKNRHEIKRKLRRFENEANTETLVISDKKNVVSALNDLIELMKQDEKKRIFFTEEKIHRTLQNLHLVLGQALRQSVTSLGTAVSDPGGLNFTRNPELKISISPQFSRP